MSASVGHQCGFSSSRHRRNVFTAFGGSYCRDCWVTESVEGIDDASLPEQVSNADLVIHAMVCYIHSIFEIGDDDRDERDTKWRRM